ncbi:uncharacterized protein [Halyomorpha halys]|uniref:uncharacterized protein n=1 Tax=Halyomorpha halys TaxID=286706 RepID=UPI0006D50CCC|nr:uncharacterized protein LOC106679590 [Halyomorpha halys]
MPLSLHDFCFVFSLQAGVVATSTIGFTIMVITFIFNCYAPNSMEAEKQICQYLTLYIYLIIMMTAFGMAFMASFWEKPKFVKIAAMILAFGTFFYFILSMISYIREGGTMKYVCPEMRCPDHHWLQDSRWRAVYIAMETKEEGKKDEDKEGKTEEQGKMSTDKGQISATEQNMAYTFGRYTQLEILGQVEYNEDIELWLDNNTKKTGNSSETSTKPPRPTTNPKEKDVLILMFVSFIYTTFFLVYFVYTVLTLFTFASQLENM